MSDLYNRLSKLLGSTAAKNILHSVPEDDSNDDQIIDYPQGIDPNFLTEEQKKDAADYQIAKNREEMGKDASDYYRAMVHDTRPLEPFSPQAPLGGLGKPENPYNQGPEASLPDFLQPLQSNEPVRTGNPNFKPELVQQPEYAHPLSLPEQPGFSPVTDQTFKQQVPQAPQNLPPVPVEVPGSPKPVPIELTKPEEGPGSIASLENLLAAQQAANNIRGSAGSLQALDQVSAGIAGLGANAIIKPSGQELFKQQGKQAEQPVEDYKNLVAMEKHDPNSPVSRSLRAYGKKLGFDMSGLSAADAEKVMPYVFKGFEAEETRKARKDELAMRLKEMNQRYQQAKEERQRNNDEKQAYKEEKDKITRFDKMGKLIAAEVASSRSSLGRMANNVRSAEAIERMVSGRKLSDLDTREIYEVARALDALLSQGQATISGSEHLIPKTARGDVAKIAEFITNKRKGAGMESFMKQMLKTVSREKDLGNEQIKKAQRKLLAPYADLKDKDPQAWGIMMKQHDLPEDPFSEEVKPKSEDLNSEFDKF